MEDLPVIEKKMDELVKKDLPIVREEMERDKSCRIFSSPSVRITKQKLLLQFQLMKQFLSIVRVTMLTFAAALTYRAQAV